MPCRSNDCPSLPIVATWKPCSTGGPFQNFWFGMAVMSTNVLVPASTAKCDISGWSSMVGSSVIATTVTSRGTLPRFSTVMR